MKAIIFGANGQDGHYLTKLLHREKVEVTGVSRSGGFRRLDISNFKEVRQIIEEINPDYIFHFAANSTTAHDAVLENHKAIVSGTLNILEAARFSASQAKIFISGSALQFVNRNLPIEETDDFVTNSAYSLSRVQSVLAARYFRSLNMRVYVGYFFNHDSPLRSERHIAKKVSEAARKIARGEQSSLEIGDIEVIKEWSFAGDLMEALWLFINQDLIYEANLGSGIGYSIAEWIEKCFNLCGISSAGKIKSIPGFNSEYLSLVSNNSKIADLGYFPKVSFETLARMMIGKPL